jgi:hypothetical protein
MRNFLGLLALAALTGPSIAYFRYQRPVESSTAGQHYLIVDETIWQHARPDLADLRLFSSETEVPYALATERGSAESDHEDVRVLQQSIVAGKTQFLIDMSDIVEYDHVDLKLSSKDFVAHARVEGQDDLHGRRWAMLGDSILYDLSKENLGGNSMLRLPQTTFHYLRVTIDGPIKPEDVTGASSEHRQVQKPVWRDVSREMSQQQQGRDTILTFHVPENMPVERLVLVIDPAQPNFRREVEIENQKNTALGSGEINRIHMVRAGQKIDSEVQDVDFSAVGQRTINVVIHNGDDTPLKLQGASLQQHERRLYFDAPASGQLTLFYGDEKLGSPLYDYAKLFQQQKNVVAASLGAETANARYTARPDDRAWSERHPAVLWIAIIAAVAALGALALRSMKTAAAA